MICYSNINEAIEAIKKLKLANDASILSWLELVGESTSKPLKVLENRIYIAHPIFSSFNGWSDRVNYQSWNDDVSFLQINKVRSDKDTLDDFLIFNRYIDPVQLELAVGSTPKEIIELDLSIIDTCDAIAYDFRSGEYSAGCSMEIFYAHHMKGIPVYTLMPKNYELSKISPWIRGHSTETFNSKKDFLQKMHGSLIEKCLPFKKNQNSL